VDASFLEVSFHYGNHREFLILTHNVPRIVISEKQQQKHKVPVTCLYLKAGPTITAVNKMSSCLRQDRNENGVVVVRERLKL